MPPASGIRALLITSAPTNAHGKLWRHFSRKFSAPENFTGSASPLSGGDRRRFLGAERASLFSAPPEGPNQMISDSENPRDRARLLRIHCTKEEALLWKHLRAKR